MDIGNIFKKLTFFWFDGFSGYILQHLPHDLHSAGNLANIVKDPNPLKNADTAESDKQIIEMHCIISPTSTCVGSGVSFENRWETRSYISSYIQKNAATIS